MATTSKLSFRARNLDATKSMPVYCADELPDLAECTPINRAVAQMPTGMEKDEENESHLQEAILAQQASTSGIAVENHVIPTPKVFAVDSGYYDSLYPVQPAPSVNQLIRVQASLSLGNEEPDYDIDSEDEAWLAERGGVTRESDFEKMMELLEGASSGLQICQPNEARSLLKDFETDLVDDVYDYWLQKRKDAAASHKIASLIPRVKTDARRDASGSDIAYVAFRRRLERMQTRKNRKNDEDSYEKILKLGHDLSRVVILFDMLRRREHTKQAVIGIDDKICKCRWAVCDFSCVLYNHILSKIKLERNATMSPTEESQDELPSSMSPTKTKGQKRKRHSRTSISEGDKDLVSRAWLRKNAELWNKPATAASILSAGASPSAVSTVDAERNAEAALDGRYTFKRRRGCIYRSSLFSTPPQVPRVSPVERFYRTFMPSASGVRCIGYARRRMGRGGRIIFDRVLVSAPSTSQSAPDPPFYAVIDTTKSYQCKLVAVDDNKDENDSSDSDEGHRTWTDEDEREYRRREELYAKRIFDVPNTGPTQRLSSDAGRDGASSQGTGEQVVVLGEDNNASGSGIAENMSVSGVREADRLRVVNLQQNGPPLNVSGSGIQPVMLTASVVGKVEKVAPLPNSSPVNYQQKRVHDHSLHISSQMSLSSETSESSPVFYAHLPPPLPPAMRLLAAGEQTAHRSPQTFEFANSGGALNQAQTLIVTANQPPRQDHLERQILTVPSQEVIIGGQNLRPRTSGRRRSFASANVAQLSSPLPRPEMNLQRLNTSGFHADIVAQATHCVDTKRLELAIKGSGARIKPTPMIAHSLLQSCPPETKTLRDLLLGAGLSNAKTALSNAAVMPAVTRTYTNPHYVPVIGEAHRYVPITNVTTTSYYVPVTDVSSPGSESMSPPTPHAVTPAVQSQSSRNYIEANEPKTQTSLAVVSGRPSLNGTQRDITGSGSAISKTNGGREHDTFITSLQVGIELQPHQVKCRAGGGASSPLNTVLAAEKPAEGNVVDRSGGNSTATAAPTVVEKMYPEPAEAGENTLSNRVTNNHRDIAACHGMIIMIRIGNHIVIQKMGGEHMRVCKVSRRAKILIEKLRFEIDGAIDQPYGLFEVSAGKLTRVTPKSVTNIAATFDFDTASSSAKVDGIKNVTDICKSSVQETGNTNAAQARQKVTQDEIIRMKDTGVRTEQLIARLVDGNVSFSERTVYSQNKYINKKAKKHSDHVFLLKPTVRLVAESYYKKDPERIAHLRIDLLSHLLALSGVHYGSRCIVFEQCLGLLTSAVITRLGGSGACIHLHRGNIAQSIPCVDSMDFDKEIGSVFLPLSISTLLEGFLEETEGSVNFGTGVRTDDKEQGTRMQVDEEDNLSEKDVPTQQHGKESDMDTTNEADEDAANGNFDNTVNKDDEDTTDEDDGGGDASAVAEGSLERRAERQRLQKQAWHLMQNGEIEILFIASKNIRPVEILEKTWSFLRISSTIVIYCPIAEPLYSAYHWLKAKGAVQVQVMDAFYRSHQVIQDRSHPIMQQLITGGLILSAVKVELR